MKAMMKLISNRKGLQFLSASLAILATTSTLTGCSSSHNIRDTDQQIAWQNDGMIMLSRPLNLNSPASNNEQPQMHMFGFMPISNENVNSFVGLHSGTWISINRSAGTISLMDGEKEINTTNGEGITDLKPGIYKLLHKQRNALWHAPDAYFIERNQIVPPGGDRARLRRGALGDFVLYINKDTPIHSGPVWTSSIGGVKLDESAISRIYYKVEVGSAVEIK